ncbi:MAG: hypothetical protein AAB393_03320 [Bacteroidota bacterium]
MKATTRISNALAIISMLIMLAATGCNEDSASPINGMQNPDQTFEKPAPYSTVIPIQGIVEDPNSEGKAFYAVGGTVTYSMTPVNRKNGNAYHLELNASGTLKPVHHDGNVLTFSEHSRHWISVSEDGVTFLTKGYSLDGAANPMILLVDFQITKDYVEVKGVQLRVLKGDIDTIDHQ